MVNSVEGQSEVILRLTFQDDQTVGTASQFTV